MHLVERSILIGLAVLAIPCVAWVLALVALGRRS
jgi:hypothetical protein